MMDELTFRRRVYADPVDPGEDVLRAAENDPNLQRILDDARRLEDRLRAALTGVSIPRGLAESLLEIPGDEEQSGTSAAPATSQKSSSRAQSIAYSLYALAATLVLAIGVVFSVYTDRELSPEELSLGPQVIAHLEHEAAELAAIRAGDLDMAYSPGAINLVLSSAGTRLTSDEFLTQMPVRYANPCLIRPRDQSAHLIMETESGPLNVIVINNSPVQREYSFSGGGLNGLVVPMRGGNLILIGEPTEDLQFRKNQLSRSVEWVI